MKKYSEEKEGKCPEWMSYTRECTPTDKNWGTMNIDRDLPTTFMNSAEEITARNARAYNVYENDGNPPNRVFGKR